MKIAVTLGIVRLFAQAPPQRPVPLAQPPEIPKVMIGDSLEVLAAEKAWAGADVLLPLALSTNPSTQIAALRAVGRLEDPRVVRQLIAIGNAPKAPIPDVAHAIAQSLKGFDPVRDPGLIADVSTWLARNCFYGVGIRRVGLPGPIGSIAYANTLQVRAAEDCLRRILDDSAYNDMKAGVYLSAARSLESLGRLNVRVTTFEEETVKWLTQMAVRTFPNDSDRVRENLGGHPKPAINGHLKTGNYLTPAKTLTRTRDV